MGPASRASRPWRRTSRSHGDHPREGRIGRRQLRQGIGYARPHGRDPCNDDGGPRRLDAGSAAKFAAISPATRPTALVTRSPSMLASQIFRATHPDRAEHGQDGRRQCPGSLDHGIHCKDLSCFYRNRHLARRAIGSSRPSNWPPHPGALGRAANKMGSWLAHSFTTASLPPLPLPHGGCLFCT